MNIIKIYSLKPNPQYARINSTNIAKTLGSTSIWHRSNPFASDRCIIDVDPRVFAIWLVQYNDWRIYVSPDLNTLGRTKRTPFCRHFQAHIFYSNVHIGIKISTKFVPNGVIDNKSSPVQIMVCKRWTPRQPLSKPVMSLFTQTPMR